MQASSRASGSSSLPMPPSSETGRRDPMKALIAAVVALALVPVASAELYKYVDKNGKTVYTDQPPTDVDAKRMSGPAVPEKGKSYVEKDKDLEKGREKAREEAKKSGESEKVAAAK